MNAGVYVAGIILQALAAAFALAATRKAPRRLPWLLIALSSLLIVARRAATLGEIRSVDAKLAPAELLTLAISLLFFLGVILMARMFDRIREEGERIRGSEERYAAAMAGSRDGLWVWELPGNEVYFSPQWKTMLGYAEDEIGSDIGEWERLMHPEDRGRVDAAVEGYLRGDSPELAVEMRMRHKDGHWITVLSRGVARRDGEGRATGLYGTNVDISGLKAAEAALVESKRLAERYLNIAAEIILSLDIQGRITLLNESGHRLLGYEAGELVGRDWFETCLPESERESVREFFSLIREGRAELSLVHENKVLLKRGGHRHIRWHNAVLRGDAGEILGILSSGEDVTERMRAEEEARDGHERLLAILEANPNPTYVADPESHELLFMNKALVELFGEAGGRPCYEHLQARTSPCPRCRDERGPGDLFGEIHTREARNGRNDRWYRCTDREITWPDGRVVRYDLAVDITDQRRIEEELRESFRYARTLIETSLDPLVTIAADGKITDVNEATILATGESRERLVGSDFADYFTDPASAREGYRKAFIEGSVVDYPLAIRQASGAVTEVLYNASVYRDEEGRVAGVFAAARDVTRLKRAEDALRDALRENKDLLRELQHRAKNSFNMIFSMISLAASPKAGPEVRAVLADLESRVKSVSELYSMLYSSGETGEIRLDEYCRRVASSLLRLANAVELRVEAEPLVASVKEAAPIGLVLAEAVTNALKHAFPGARRGTIGVSLAKTARGAVLEVSDDGVGPVGGPGPRGQGGLGLDLMAGLAAQIDGSFSLEPGEPGTRAVLDFPLGGNRD